MIRSKVKRQEELKSLSGISIILVPKQTYGVNSPIMSGIFIYSTEGRMQREVLHLRSLKTETIDPFEQMYLSISAEDKQTESHHEYVEILPDAILSELAAQTPFMIHNQSPRNMY